MFMIAFRSCADADVTIREGNLTLDKESSQTDLLCIPFSRHIPHFKIPHTTAEVGWTINWFNTCDSS